MGGGGAAPKTRPASHRTVAASRSFDGGTSTTPRSTTPNTNKDHTPPFVDAATATATAGLAAPGNFDLRHQNVPICFKFWTSAWVLMGSTLNKFGHYQYLYIFVPGVVSALPVRSKIKFKKMFFCSRQRREGPLAGDRPRPSQHPVGRVHPGLRTHVHSRPGGACRLPHRLQVSRLRTEQERRHCQLGFLPGRPGLAAHSRPLCRHVAAVSDGRVAGKECGRFSVSLTYGSFPQQSPLVLQLVPYIFPLLVNSRPDANAKECFPSAVQVFFYLFRRNE
jgi:hypothetical protein